MNGRGEANTAASNRPTLPDGGQGFDHRFTPAGPAPHPYFLHVVDGQKATLEVKVFRPDLGFTFTHSRALQSRLAPSAIAFNLEKKTTGFLALVSPPPSPSPAAATGRDGERPRLSPGRHTVLAWAESGHGAGKEGDLVDAGAGNHALANTAWTRRVIRLARALGQNMDSPFDTMGGHRRGDEFRGNFRASHVEVKLAAHAIHLLLHLFAPPAAPAAATPADDATSDARVMAARRRLRALRLARWTDGSRPAFDIVVSRRRCVPCGLFVSRLSRLTGIKMNIVWGQRLAPAVYKQPVVPPKVVRRAAGEDKGGDGFDWGRFVYDQEDDDDDDEVKDERDMDDGAQEPITPAPFTPTKQVATDADDAISSPPARPRRRPRDLLPRPAPGGIAKPLPATPETEPPSWMAPAVRERRRRQGYAAGCGHRIGVDDEDEEAW